LNNNNNNNRHIEVSVEQQQHCFPSLPKVVYTRWMSTRLSSNCLL
jgi:hypothetical protein